jgi:phosphoglycerol transferase
VFAIGFSQIRAYNRIVVYIAFFAFLGVCVLFDTALKKVPKDSRLIVAVLAAAVVLIVGIADQTTPAMVPSYDEIKAAWQSNGEFVTSLETGVQDGAQVLQLPYVPFPENPPVFQMTDYDHFRPYLQSSKIHWSYGAVRGREAAAWNEQVSALPADKLVAAARNKGFVGVWVDRAGYQDQGTEIMRSLAVATAGQPRLSADGRYAYFSIAK